MSADLHTILNAQGLEEALVSEILSTGHARKLTAGAPLISPGVRSEHMPLVVSGTLRIMREDEEGNELFLYYLEGGEACAMSIRCCMHNEMSGFKALAFFSLWSPLRISWRTSQNSSSCELR